MPRLGQGGLIQRILSPTFPGTLQAEVTKMRPNTFLAALLLGATVTAQSDPTLVSVVSVGDYFGAVYAQRTVPEAEYTYFVGECIEIRAWVENRGELTQSVRWSGSGSTSPVVATSHRDGESVRLAFEVHGLEIRTQSGDLVPTNETADSVAVAPGERLERLVTVRSNLRPGVYEVRLQLNAADSDRRAVFQQVSKMSFEVRASTDYTPEVLRREGYRRVVAGDLAGAQEAAGRLRQLNPSSHAASLIESEVAWRTGRDADATRLVEQAIAEAASGRDSLLVRFVGAAGVAAFARGLATNARRR